MKKKNLGFMLLESKLIDEIQTRIALEEQKRTGKRFGSTLVDLKFIDENVLAAFLSKQMDIPCLNIMHVDVPARVRDLIPYELAKRCEAVPVKLDPERLYMAMVDPTDINLISDLEETAGMPISPFIAPQSAIHSKLESMYRDSEEEEQSDNPIFSDVLHEVESMNALENRLNQMDCHMQEIRDLLRKLVSHLKENGD